MMVAERERKEIKAYAEGEGRKEVSETIDGRHERERKEMKAICRGKREVSANAGC
jgi:hypothetical protein